MTLTNAGNLGIGTTSPYAKLSVVGEPVSSYFTATSTTAPTPFNGGFAVGTGVSPSGLVYVRSTGNIGIGTTPHASAKIHLRSGTDDNMWVRSISDFGGIYTGTDGIGLQILSDGVSGRDFSVLATKIDLSVAAGEAALRVDSTGNVGIGTTSPYAKLSVVGEVVASNLTATSTTATSTFAGGFAVGTGASPSGLVYDRSTGFVGVGTNAPAAGFHLKSAGTTNLIIEHANNFNGGLQINEAGVNKWNFTNP